MPPPSNDFNDIEFLHGRESPNDPSSPLEGTSRDHLKLFRCYYNFIRPRRALKFGREVRTPAMPGGLTRRHLMFREIFEAGHFIFWRRKMSYSRSLTRHGRSVWLLDECLWRLSNT
jgi:hypothetical protein